MCCCAFLYVLLIAIYFSLLLNQIINDLDKTYAIFKGLVYLIEFIAIGFTADSMYWKNILKKN